MIYVFDTNCFKPLEHYFPDRFPSFWEKFDKYTLDGKIISVREAYKELENYGKDTHVIDWVKRNKEIFLVPTQEEMEFVSKIFAVPNFQYLVGIKDRGIQKPVADPFVIASAKIKNGCVVTDEKLKPNSPKIPNVCQHFGVECTDFEGFMKREKWIF